MPTLTVLGRELQVRGLTPLELEQWNSHVSRLFGGVYWADLYESVNGLPGNLQEVIMASARLPAKLDRLQYFRVATRIESVKLLISMTVVNPWGLLASLNNENAAEIFWDLQPLILNKAVVLPAAEGLAKLREESDGRQ